MVSRSTFSCDHRFATGDITNRRQATHMNFFMKRSPEDKSKRRLYSADLAVGMEWFVKLFQNIFRRPKANCPVVRLFASGSSFPSRPLGPFFATFAVKSSLFIL